VIDQELLELLACPICPTRPPVKQEQNFLICTDCKRGYRIIDGIPRMLPEDAVPQDVWEGELG
jgi:uncharacterized protein YbaR (Trm112 family)